MFCFFGLRAALWANGFYVNPIMEFALSECVSFWGLHCNDWLSETEHYYIHSWGVCEELPDVFESWRANIWQCQPCNPGNETIKKACALFKSTIVALLNSLQLTYLLEVTNHAKPALGLNIMSFPLSCRAGLSGRSPPGF